MALSDQIRIPCVMMRGGTSRTEGSSAHDGPFHTKEEEMVEERANLDYAAEDDGDTSDDTSDDESPDDGAGPTPAEDERAANLTSRAGIARERLFERALDLRGRANRPMNVIPDGRIR